MHIKGFLKHKSHLEKNTLISYGKILIKFEKFLINNDLENIKNIDKMIIQSFINELEKENMKISTINKYISTINNYFDYLFEIGYIDKKVKFKNLKTEKHKNKEIITEDEFQSSIVKICIVDNYNKRDILIMNFLYYTDLKLKEILNIKVDNIKDNCQFINLNGSIKSVPRNLVGLLLDFLNEYYNDYLFTNYKGNKLSRQAVWKMLNKYNKKFQLNFSTEILNRSYKVNKLLRNYIKEEI